MFFIFFVDVREKIVDEVSEERSQAGKHLQENYFAESFISTWRVILIYTLFFQVSCPFKTWEIIAYSDFLSFEVLTNDWLLTFTDLMKNVKIVIFISHFSLLITKSYIDWLIRFTDISPNHSWCRGKCGFMLFSQSAFALKWI